MTLTADQVEQAFCDTAAAAKILDVSQATIRRLAKAGRIRKVCVTPTAVRYLISELRTFGVIPPTTDLSFLD